MSERGSGLIEAVRQLLAEQAHSAAFGTALAGLPEQEIGRLGARDSDVPLPGRDWAALASLASTAAADAAVALFDRLDWLLPYRGDPKTGRRFNEETRAAQIFGPNAPITHNSTAAGFFAVGADVDYNDHRHAPCELYLPLAGTADYWTEGGGWHQVLPGTAIVHAPWEWHAMRTGDDPVLIFWTWIDLNGRFELPELRSSLGGDARGSDTP